VVGAEPEVRRRGCLEGVRPASLAHSTGKPDRMRSRGAARLPPSTSPNGRACPCAPFTILARRAKIVNVSDEEPLPIKLGPVSNGEFLPIPHSPFVREVI